MKKTLSLILVLVLSMTLLSTAQSAIPSEYIGEWAGSVDNINLSFNVNEDGTGTYTFEQGGYMENYDFSLSVESETFSVKIPEASQLGIVSCEGTYTYTDGILTLAVQTTQSSGRVFEYTVPCKRVIQSEEAISRIPDEYIGKWAGVTGDISLVFEISADGRAQFTFEQGGYSDSNDVALSVTDETFSIEIPKDDKLGAVSGGGSYTYADGVLTVSVEITFADGRVFSYTVPCEKVDTEETSDSTNATEHSKSVFPVTVKSFGESFIIYGYKIGFDDNGNTKIVLFGKNLLLFGFGFNYVVCTIECGGEVFKDDVRDQTDRSAVFVIFPTSATPDIITLKNGETREVLASFNVEDEPQWK